MESIFLDSLNPDCLCNLLCPIEWVRYHIILVLSLHLNLIAFFCLLFMGSLPLASHEQSELACLKTWHHIYPTS
jgi:hypothetical protein